jgi:hypothetical protein
MFGIEMQGIYHWRKKQGFFHLEYDEEERPKLYINITSALM